MYAQYLPAYLQNPWGVVEDDGRHFVAWLRGLSDRFSKRMPGAIGWILFCYASDALTQLGIIEIIYLHRASTHGFDSRNPACRNLGVD